MTPRMKVEELEHAEEQQSITKESDERSSENDEKVGEACIWPEVTGDRLQRIIKSWTFCYMRPLLQKGRQQALGGAHLVHEDLYECPPTMKSDELLSVFSKFYEEENGNLLRVLWRLAAPTFVPGGVVQLVYIGARITLPLSMKELLTVLEEHPNESVVGRGLPFAVTIFVAAVVAAFAQHRQVHLSKKSGIVVRTALITKIYEHALKLSSTGKAGLTSGEVTNLVATDTQKIFEVFEEGQNLWSTPVFIVVVTALLWVVMGPELIVGVIVLIAFVPVVQKIVQTMLKIRKKRASLVDYRINIISSMLQGIHVTKLNHYESKVLERVSEVRAREMKLLRSELFMWGWTLASAVSSPLMATAASFSCYALIRKDSIITPSSAFAVLLLFSVLRFPINLGARLVGKLAQALDSAHRISDFLQRETRSGNLLETSDSLHQDRPLIKVTNATFVAGNQDSDSTETSNLSGILRENSDDLNFKVRNISLMVNQSQVCAVVGRVGSGKSLLLQGLMGELCSESAGEVSLQGTIGYAAQVPFILNATLRDNVLFGSSYDKERYERALLACCLEQDIQQFPGGDMCQIGERGVTLSGGQKQRVSLARVLYANPDIALLDDVFSALDSGTSSAVFDALFGPESGALKSQGTILVTHATKFLPHMDNIIVLSAGNPIFSGAWTDLQKSEGNDTLEVLDSDLGLASPEGLDEDDLDKQGKVKDLVEKEELIMTAEEKESGLSSLRIWYIWFEHAGGRTFLFFQVLFLVFDRMMYVASEWWISKWAQASDESVLFFGRSFPPQTDGRSAQIQYVIVYFIILALSVVATTLRSHWGVQGGARCAEKLFSAMTSSVLGAPMSYFETTPLGRVLNRFTYDIEVLDIELSVSMAGLFISFSWFSASICAMISVLPWIIFALVPVIGVYLVLQSYHRLTGPDLQRLDAMSRSPLQAQLAEALDGSMTIRAFDRTTYFFNKFREAVDRNASAMLNFDASQRWLALRIELLGSLITLAACLMIVFANNTLRIPSSLVGFLITWSIVFTTSLGFLLERFTETEARITSIERVKFTSELPQEAPWSTDPSAKPDKNWPSKGELIFDKVSLRYRSGLPLALDSISFTLKPGTRCGVCGRTGSGKSSLTVALFRLVEIESGRITLDSVDLSKIGLGDVRGRSHGLRIIPQDPVLFAGSLRNCLDPFNTQEDGNLMDALKAVNHSGWERGSAILDDRVDEGGANFSVGERQLLCLARAIVEEPKVLVMDEASASLDSESDQRIQKMLRERFQNTTMLTIAHRLDTILDYDQILVLDSGRVAEFGSPEELLKRSDGMFSSLIKGTGK